MEVKKGVSNRSLLYYITIIPFCHKLDMRGSCPPPDHHPSPSTTWQGPLPTTPSGSHPKNSKLARYKLLQIKDNLSIESEAPGSIFLLRASREPNQVKVRFAPFPCKVHRLSK